MDLKPLTITSALTSRNRPESDIDADIVLWGMALKRRSTTGTTTKVWTCAGKFC